MKTLQERLKHARTLKGMSQAGLGKAIGKSQSAIAALESGRNKESTNTASIARVLGISPLWLETGQGEMKNESALALTALDQVVNLSKNIDYLIKQRGITTEEVSKNTGIPAEAIDKAIAGEIETPNMTRLKVLASFFDVDYSVLTDTDIANTGIQAKAPSDDKFVVVNYYTARGECGEGEMNEFVEVRGGLAFPRDMLISLNVDVDSAAIITASGDSMATTIFNGNSVLIDTSKRTIEEERIYAIQRSGNGLIIKRIRMDMNGNHYYHSDNPNQSKYAPMYPLENDHIVGRVMWQGGTGGLL